jgi:hypothetical protein
MGGAALLRRVLGIASLGALAVGCGIGSVDGGPDAGGPDLGDPANARMRPEVAHTGHDGVSTFLIPISTDLTHFASGQLEWSSADESIAEVEPVEEPAQYPGRGGWAMVETRQPGETSISAAIGEHDVSGRIVVADYTSAQVAAGRARYRDAGVGDRVPCASCHEAAGGADHTPSEMAYHDDAALLLVITDGHYPDLCTTEAGDDCECGSDGCVTEPGYVLEVDHRWNLTAQEADGIVAFLRTLAPSGF